VTQRLAAPRVGPGLVRGRGHTALALWKALRPVFAVVFNSGAAVTFYDLATLGQRGSIFLDHDGAIDRDELHHRLVSPPTYSARRLRLSSIGGWLGAMRPFGGIITLGLLSFNFEAVRAGDPTLPYVLAGIGYTGL
jgi:nitric oxide reductase subunit B